MPALSVELDQLAYVQLHGRAAVPSPLLSEYYRGLVQLEGYAGAELIAAPGAEDRQSHNAGEVHEGVARCLHGKRGDVAIAQYSAAQWELREEQKPAKGQADVADFSGVAQHVKSVAQRPNKYQQGAFAFT